MELLLTQSEPSPGKQISFWKSPSAWLHAKNLGNGYWIFFMAAFFFDAGFAIYVFLFNLYLLDLHFNERAMGLIGGSMTLGSLIGTLPAGLLARKIGLRPLLIFCFITASLLRRCVLYGCGYRRSSAWHFSQGWQCAVGESASFQQWRD